MKNLVNIIINLLQKKNFVIILNKIYLMFFDKTPKLSNKKNI